MKHLLFFLCILCSISAFAQRLEFNNGYLKFSRFPPDPRSRDTIQEFYPIKNIFTSFNKFRNELTLRYLQGQKDTLIYTGNLRYTFLGPSRNLKYDSIIRTMDRALLGTDTTIVSIASNSLRRDSITSFATKYSTNGKEFQVEVRQKTTTTTPVWYEIYEYSAHSRDSNLLHTLFADLGLAAGTVLRTPPLLSISDTIRIHEVKPQNYPATNHALHITRNVNKCGATTTKMVNFDGFDYGISDQYSKIYDVSRSKYIAISARNKLNNDLVFQIQASQDRISWYNIGSENTVAGLSNTPQFVLNETLNSFKYLRFKTGTVLFPPSHEDFKYIAIHCSQ